MKFQILSDTHFEAWHYSPEAFFNTCFECAADNIIIAGDLCDKKDFELYMDRFAMRFNHVVFVPGNHDYYGYSIPYMNEYFKSQSNDRIHVLIDDVVTIEGIRIAGTPLWFSKPVNPFAELEIRKNINDFNYIKDFEKDVYTANHNSIEFLKNVEADVIVTHFIPTAKSIHERYIGSLDNDYFVCPVLDKYPIQTKHWIHGHTHDFFDYEYCDGIQVTCNPFGVGGSNMAFLEDCTIEVDGNVS